MNSRIDKDLWRVIGKTALLLNREAKKEASRVDASRALAQAFDENEVVIRKALKSISGDLK